MADSLAEKWAFGSDEWDAARFECWSLFIGLARLTDDAHMMCVLYVDEYGGWWVHSVLQLNRQAEAVLKAETPIPGRSPWTLEVVTLK